MLSGSFESLFDQVQIRFRRGDAMLGFFLEGVQHVYDSGEANGVDGAIRLTIEIVHDLQNTGATKSLQGFGVGCLATQLCIPKRTADSPADLLWKASQVLPAAPDPAYRLWLGGVSSRHRLLPARILCQFRHRVQAIGVRSRVRHDCSFGLQRSPPRFTVSSTCQASGD